MKGLKYLLLLLPCLTFAQVDDDFFVSYTQANQCPSGYFDDSAATPGSCEVNGTAMTIADEYTITSTTSSVQEGSYALSFVKTTVAGVDCSAGIQLQNMTIGQSYNIAFYARVSTPTNSNNNYLRASGLYAADWTVTQQIEIDPTPGYVLYNMTVTPAVTNPRLQVYSSTVAVNVLGTEILIDNIVITEN